MVALFGSLPAAKGRKLDTRLRELANTVCPSDGRTFDQREADALDALVDGLDYLPCACGREDCPQQPREDNQPTEPGYDGKGHGTPGGRVARKPLVHVIMLDSTLHGDDEQPAYLDGYGLIDADTARNLANDGDITHVRVPDDVHHHRTQHTTEDAQLPDSAFAYRPSAVLDTWIRTLGGMCQWLHCDTPAWNTDLDHDTPFNHRNPRAGGKTTAASMKPYCRTHHRITHSQAWSQRLNPDGSIDLISPTGHHYHSRRSGYLDLLGINPDRITDPDKPQRRRRTRAENQAARTRAERRHQQTKLDLAALRWQPPRTPTSRSRTDEPPPDDDCPF